jgi:hypothetical protein
MAKASTARKARRAANNAGKATPAVTGVAGKSKIEWDASRPLVVKAIAYGVAHETTNAAHAIVEQFNLDTAAIVHKQADVTCARDLLNAIRRRVCEKRGIKWTTDEHASANRVSDYKKVLAMSGLACLSNLIANLRKIETLTIEGLYDVAVYMVGTRKQAAKWKADAVSAPTVEVLTKVIARRKSRVNKNNTATRKPKRKGVMGMPTTDAPRSLAYCVAAIAALIKHHGKAMTAAERKQADAATKNLGTLKDAMVRIKAAANAAEAE